MNKYVLAIGELLADVISTDYCESLKDARSFSLTQGGSPANLAANINHLGGHALLVGCVGNDGIGNYLRSVLKDCGLDDSYIQVHASEPTSVVMVTKSRGTPDFIAYRHADACIGAVDETLLKKASVMHTTAFALSRHPAQNTILRAVESAFAQSKTISVDWNFAPQIWGSDDGRLVFEKLMKKKPLLKISVDDMERFWNRSLTASECMGLLQHYDALAICLTCGKDGIWYKQPSTTWMHEPAVVIENIVDVTGAGDTFWAGFLTAFLREFSIASCVKEGAFAAAKKVQKMGPLYK